jgi:hypothetical protein
MMKTECAKKCAKKFLDIRGIACSCSRFRYYYWATNPLMRYFPPPMNKRTNNIVKALAIAVAGLMLSFSVKALAVEAEMSHVTLFVEGMMKSRGGVT